MRQAQPAGRRTTKLVLVEVQVDRSHGSPQHRLDTMTTVDGPWATSHRRRLRRGFADGVLADQAQRVTQLRQLRRLLDEQEERLVGGARRRPRQAAGRGLRHGDRLHHRRDRPRPRRPPGVDGAGAGQGAADVQARFGPHRQPAARRRARHRPVELPGAAVAGPAGRRARGRQRRRAQAVRAGAGDVGGARRAGAGVPRRPRRRRRRGRGRRRRRRCWPSASTTSSTPAAARSGAS